MHLQEAIQLVQSGINNLNGTWADLGAGTGLFTQALGAILGKDAQIIAVDKNPHSLYNLQREVDFNIQIIDADFTRPMDLPQLDGLIMANALHYSRQPAKTLKNILSHLKTGGDFILIEYDTTRAVPIWVPYPIPFQKFVTLAEEVNLSPPIKLAEKPSRYGNGMIYAAHAVLS